MIDETNTFQDTYRKRRPSLIWARSLVVGTLFLSGLVALFFGYGGFQTILSFLGFSTEQSQGASSFQGVLYVSAVTADPDTGATTGVVPFLVDSASHLASYIPFDDLTTGRVLGLQYAASDDASGIVFLGTPVASSSDPEAQRQKVPSVYHADLRDAESFDEAVQAVQNARMVAAPTNLDYFREFPVVSVGQQVAYASLDEASFTRNKEDIASLRAEDWSIMVLDESDEVHKVASGVHPKWIGRDILAYLKNDGVYAQDIDTGDEWEVLPLDFVPNIASGFDVSNDSQFLAVTSPEAKQMIVLRVLDWNSALLSAYSYVQKSASSPVFSPDGSHIAMFVVNKKGQTEVAFYSLADKRFEQGVVTFDSDSTAGLYLTDWR